MGQDTPVKPPIRFKRLTEKIKKSFLEKLKDFFCKKRSE